MRSLSFSLLAVGLGSIGGLRPIGRPPSSFLSLSVQPSILIALLLGWNIIGDRRDGRPALQLLLASFDVEESAAQEAGRGSGYPPPPLYGRNARYPRYFRVEKLHLASLSLSLFGFISTGGYLLPSLDALIYMYVYIYIRSPPLGYIEEKRQVYLGEKKCLPGSLPGNEHPRNEFNGFTYFSMSRFYRWIGNFILDSRRSARSIPCSNDC